VKCPMVIKGVGSTSCSARTETVQSKIVMWR
jgi:hypothetical protein